MFILYVFYEEINLIKTKKNDIKLRPEDQLLLCCARTRVDDEIRDKIVSLVSQDLDWDYLIRMASRNRLIPLLYVNLNSICPENVPKHILNQLKNNFQENARKNLLLSGELIKAINLLNSHNISAIPYKGPVLASLAYKNIALRVMGDLDILIKKEDALKVKKLMQNEGYRLNYKIDMEDDLYMKLITEHLFLSDNGVSLEIKWRFEGDLFSFSTTTDILSENLNKTDFSGTLVDTFSPENQLLVLSVHSAKHDWSSLSWICDIAEFIKNNSIDWSQTMHRAEELGVKRILIINLILARDLFDLKLPKEILDYLYSDSTAETISKRVKRRIFLKQKITLNIFEKSFFDLRKRENLLYGIKDCTSSLIKPSHRDYEDIPLPEYLFPVYYFIRPFLLLRRYGKEPI